MQEARQQQRPGQHAQEPAPQPGLRRGPRPLLLHLALATLKSTGSADTWPSSSDDWLSLINRFNLNAPAAVGGLPPLGPDAALIRGIAAYRRHPYVRDVADPPAIWTEGGARLLDYGGAGAVPLLLVPSLVNRANILDLSQARSMARYLAGRGLRVLLLDWGWPGELERSIGLDGLITGRLARAIAAAGPKVTLVGYCMGGLLCLAAAQLQPQRIAGLALLATPWDFHAGRPGFSSIMPKVLEAVEPILQVSGTMPIDVLQLLFTIGDPHGVGNKYRAFGEAPQDTDRARQFVAIEDWLNDGVPLAAVVARECLSGWYGDNAPMRGTWRIGERAIKPGLLSMPTFIAVPGRDRIVPPESAMPLVAQIPGALVVRPKAGHVGMVAGTKAEAELWSRLAEWALAIAPGERDFRKRRRAGKLA
jgi:polyhydroxyalkanoate synthase